MSCIHALSDWIFQHIMKSFAQVIVFNSPSPNHQVAVESHPFTALPAPS